MNLLMIFLAMALVSCRPASDVVDKSTKTESVSYRPGAKITISASDTENPTPLFTADASLICSDLSFYDPNGALIQGTRDCSESLPECREDGDIDCRATANNPSVIKTELETKIIAGESLAGVEGAANGSAYSVCTGAGQSACIATTTYQTMDLSLADSSTDLTTSNFNATIATSGNFQFWDATGARHVVSGDTNLTAINIKDGVSLFGIAGSLTGAPPNCASDGEGSCLVDGTNYRAAATAGAASKILSGQTLAGVSGNVTLPVQGTVLTGTNYGVAGTGSSGTLTLPSAANVRSGTGSYGNPGSPVTPSYNPDFPDLANVRESDTVDGANGTLSDCTAAGQAGCVATTTYATMDLSNKDTGGALDLNAADFNTRITSASLFEYWDEDGLRYTANGDADIVATNIKDSVEIFGTTGSLAESPANCSSNGSQSCVATGSYYAATACASNGADTCYLNPAGSYDAADLSNLSAGNIRRGITIAGTTGNFPSSTVSTLCSAVEI